MANLRNPASFRPIDQQDQAFANDLSESFTLHLPPSSSARQLVAGSIPINSGGSEEGLGASSWGGSGDVEDVVCPSCGQSTLMKCMVDEGRAIRMCVDTNCTYPFMDKEGLANHILPMTQKEVLETARKRMVEVGIGANTATRIANTPQRSGSGSGSS
ncbi:hypothetical protein BZA70DRAFT_57255 [Myxozyma melibiosi]|uniref:Uncharacterized protein n=1 Tax=Myxozyma melibiosi TaxID=54550 RepID=A0ABR1FFZ1_9ASCO